MVGAVGVMVSFVDKKNPTTDLPGGRGVVIGGLVGEYGRVVQLG